MAVQGNNVLIRGSLPIGSDSNFVYDQILAFVTTKLPSINFTNSTLIDVSVIGNMKTGEWKQLKQELTAFNLANTAIPYDSWPPYTVGYKATLLGSQVSGHASRFCWWPFQGFKSWWSQDQKIKQYFTNEGYNGEKGGYNFDGLVDQLDFLLKDESYPKIIYYHCTFGKDRTGALTFGWLVKHGGYSKTDALAKVDSVSIPNDDYSGMINDYFTWLFP